MEGRLKPALRRVWRDFALIRANIFRQENRVTIRTLTFGFVVMLPAWAQSGSASGQIEPNAGNW